MTAAVCPNGHADVNLQAGFCNVCGSALVDARPELPKRPTIAPPAPPLEEPADEEHRNAGRIEAAAREGKWDTWENAVFDAYADGARIVTLIGYSKSGKTFFANRLRRQLRLAPEWTVWPGEQLQIPKTPEFTVEGTYISRHARRKRQYLLADVDGEAYSRSVERTVGSSGIAVERRYALLSGLASGYILMIPAGTDLYKQELVDRFDVIVGCILAMHDRLRKAPDKRAAVAEPLTGIDAGKALQQSIRCDTPMQVLFAKADLFKEVDKSDTDPYAFAMRNANSLYRTIDKHFATHRFDFVSAFDGHAETDFEVNYQLPSYGTVAAFEWIDSMTAPIPLLKPLYKQTTRAAKSVRWLLDPAYRHTRARARKR